MIYLRQSTASQEISLGPFVDSTDGNTPETGLTIANTDIKIRKAGATTLANKNSGGATHISGGVYTATLDATDTDTLGSGEIYCQVSGALYVKDRFTVLPAQVYDSLILGSDLLQVDVSSVAANAITASALATDAITEIQSGLATGAAVDALPTATENADALLNRDMAAVDDSNDRTPLNALRFLRNRWSVAGDVLTVRKENDSTAAWTASVSTDAGALPITGTDPA